MPSHVGEGKGAVFQRMPFERAGCGEKRIGFSAKSHLVEAADVALDFEEHRAIIEFILRDNVDFVFPLAVPLCADTGPLTAFSQFRAKPAFKCKSRENVPIAADNC